MDVASNPFAILTVISAPAILTNASCVLTFGTGNRYGRAIDRVHELAVDIDTIESGDEEQLRLRVRQLDATERRTLLIVRALNCFYMAIAGFVTSTLITLLGNLIASSRVNAALFGYLAVVLCAAGVMSLIIGSTFLVRETAFSALVLSEERKFLVDRAHRRVQGLGDRTPA